MNILKRKNLVRSISIGIVVTMIFTGIFAYIMRIQYKAYSKIINQKVSAIVDTVLDKYPEIKEEEIIEILNSKDSNKVNVLKKYGYDEDTVAYIKELYETINRNKIQNIALVIFLGLTLLTMYLFYICIQERKIKEINEYIRGVNNKNYTLKIEDNEDGELSRLRNELYKTTVLLKESAEISETEKENLSLAIADISHQLKTPLTSIRIMLDNISDNPNMEQDIRNDFIKEISKQVDWISSLVISLLKMARFDAGTIKMDNKEINVNALIKNIISNLAILIELKEIEIVTCIDAKATFFGDYKWQQEAITNIIKNAIEHSKPKSKIYITTENTSVFLKIKIRDEGMGISKEEQKHIFERFYKSKNSSEDSIGIGLSLAKTIIEKNNGYIKVDSELDKGTTFEVKYLK